MQTPETGEDVQERVLSRTLATAEPSDLIDDDPFTSSGGPDTN